MLDGAVDLARDRQLVESCQAGDETAFAELYTRYHRRLHRFCLRRLHAADDADEAVQEAFVRAWRALPRFAGERRFYPWLTVIAGNVCTDILRRRSRLVPMDEVPGRAADGAVPDVDEDLMRSVDLAMASQAWGHLSDRHQRVLRLREATEWSAQRIAEHEGLAVPAVDTLLWRARQAFKREYAALADTGGAAAVLGLVGLGRRALSRAAARLVAFGHTVRGPGALAAALAVTGAAIAGGGVALVGSGSPPHARPAGLTTRTGGSPARPAAPAASAGHLAPSSTQPAAPAGASGTQGATQGAPTPAAGTTSQPAGGTTGGPSVAAGQATTAVGGVVSGVTGTVGQVVTGVTSTAGSAIASLPQPAPTLLKPLTTATPALKGLTTGPTPGTRTRTLLGLGGILP